MSQQQIVLSERHMEGNKAVQKTTYYDGSTEAVGVLINLVVIWPVSLLLKLVVILPVLLWPFTLLLCVMHMTFEAMQHMGAHPLVAIVLTAIVTACIVAAFLRFRLFCYIYFFINSTIIASVVYYLFGATDLSAMLATIIFLAAMVGGVLIELYLKNEGLETLRNWISDITGQQTRSSVYR